MVAGTRPDHQPVRVIAHRKVRLREHRAQHGDRRGRAGSPGPSPTTALGRRRPPHRLHRVDREREGVLRRVLLRHLAHRAGDRLVIAGTGQGHHLARVRSGRELRVREHDLQDRQGRHRRHRLQVVDHHARRCLRRLRLRHLGHRLGNLLVVRRPGPGNQPRRVGAHAELRLREHRAQHGNQPGCAQRGGRRLALGTRLARGAGRFHRVDHQRVGRLRRLFLRHLFQGRLDRRLVVRSGKGHHLGRIAPHAELRVGEHRAQDRHRVGRRAPGQRVDLHTRRCLRRLRLRHLRQGLLNVGVIGGPSPGDDSPWIRADGELCVGEHPLQDHQGRIAGGAACAAPAALGRGTNCGRIDRIDHQRARDVRRFLGGDLGQHGLERFVVGGTRPSHHLAHLAAIAELHVGEHGPQGADGRHGRTRFERINHDRARGVGAVLLPQLLHGRLDALVILGPGVGH